MKYLEKPFIKVGLLTFIFLVTIFSRPFVGIYLFQFRIGELVVAVSFIMFLFFISKRQNFENKYPSNNVPRPPYWSGWRLIPVQIEFWLDGEGRIHERLNYVQRNNEWKKELLYP